MIFWLSEIPMTGPLVQLEHCLHPRWTVECSEQTDSAGARELFAAEKELDRERAVQTDWWMTTLLTTARYQRKAIISHSETV